MHAKTLQEQIAAGDLLVHQLSARLQTMDGVQVSMVAQTDFEGHDLCGQGMWQEPNPTWAQVSVLMLVQAKLCQCLGCKMC